MSIQQQKAETCEKTKTNNNKKTEKKKGERVKTYSVQERCSIQMTKTEPSIINMFNELKEKISKSQRKNYKK